MPFPFSPSSRGHWNAVDPNSGKLLLGGQLKFSVYLWTFEQVMKNLENLSLVEDKIDYALRDNEIRILKGNIRQLIVDNKQLTDRYKVLLCAVLRDYDYPEEF